MKKIDLSLQDISYLALFIIMIATILISINAKASPEFDMLMEIEVTEGDTLWSIASQYTDEIPVQTYIAYIKMHNELQHDYIYPGQKLLVPLEEKHKVVKDESDYLLSSKH